MGSSAHDHGKFYNFLETHVFQRLQVRTLLAESRYQRLKFDSIEIASCKFAAGLQYDVLQIQNSIKLVRDDLTLFKSDMANLGESLQADNDLLKVLAKRNKNSGSALSHFGSFELCRLVQTLLFTQRPQPADHQPHLPRKISPATTKNRVHRRWSAYQLPVGLLSIEAPKNSRSKRLNPTSATKKGNREISMRPNGYLSTSSSRKSRTQRLFDRVQHNFRRWRSAAQHVHEYCE